MQLANQVAVITGGARGIVASFSAVVSRIDPHFTYLHIERTVEYATQILAKLREQGFAFDETQEEVLLAGILLHDIGKIFTPKEVLYKPGPLTDEEWTVIKRHPVDGSEILGRISSLKEIATNVRHHHERYDGTGYPDGLKGDAIPIGARIACVVDAFDAMVCDRPYRKGMGVEKAVAELKRCRGTQFDPIVVDVLVSLYEEGKLHVEHAHHAETAHPPIPSTPPPHDCCP